MRLRLNKSFLYLLPVFLGCLVFVFPGIGYSAEEFGLGPLWDHFRLTLAEGYRTEALGPFFYSEHKDSQDTWAIPPLTSHLRDPDVDSEEFDLCYPLLTYDRYGSEYRWQLFQLLSFAGGQNLDEQTNHRFTL